MALDLGYWSGMPDKDSGQRAEVVAPTVVTNVVKEVVTNIVAVQLPIEPGLPSFIEVEIRRRLNKPTGELTKEDLNRVTWLNLRNHNPTELKGLDKLTKLESLTNLMLCNNPLTDVKGLEKLTQLKTLSLGSNPALTKALIDELQKALPKCKIISDFE